MKRFTAIFITTVFLTVSLIFPVSADTTDISANTSLQAESVVSVTIALNSETVISNGAEGKITPPLMVFGRTYADLYALSPYLGISPEWVQDTVGFFRAGKDGKAIDFTLISKWDDLINEKHRFFVKDSKVFVSLRELCDFAGYGITYTEGIITIGNSVNSYTDKFGTVNTSPCDDYIYTTYPRPAQYVVNPYREYGYTDMTEDAKKLKEMYPDLIKLSSVGKSVEGRELMLIEFGRGENRIFVCGAHHAREYITTTYLMYAIDRYALCYRGNAMWGQHNVREILDNVTFCIVPMVNPDGVNLVQNGLYATANVGEVSALPIYEGRKYGHKAWKANIRGVDLNWNYNKDWTYDKSKNGRGSSGFNGDYPHSEPETIAIADYVDANPFDAYFSFHTQGEIFYWADYAENPTNLRDLIEKDTGFKPYKDEGIGVGGSFFDYVYRKYRKPTVTIELCPYIGNFPYPDSDFDTVWNPAKNILLIAGGEITHHKSLNQTK